MCETHMLEKTGKTVQEHQELTVKSYQTLSELAPDIPWRPVLQGWGPDDYHKHLAMYRMVGFTDTYFGLGSVCRRQSTDGIDKPITDLSSEGISLHAFGFKTRGLKVSYKELKSSDSLAWSYNARRHPPIEGHTHKSCANCIVWALRWRDKLLSKLDEEYLE